MNKNATYFVVAILLGLFGVIVVGADVVVRGQLHVTNAFVGFLSVLLALSFAIPVKMKEAIAILTPFLDKLRKVETDVG